MVKEETDTQSSLSSNSSNDVLYCSGTFELDVDLTQTRSLSTSSTLSAASDEDDLILTDDKIRTDDTNNKNCRTNNDVNIPKEDGKEESSYVDIYDELFLDYKSSLSCDSDSDIGREDEDKDSRSNQDDIELFFDAPSKINLDGTSFDNLLNGESGDSFDEIFLTNESEDDDDEAQFFSAYETSVGDTLERITHDLTNCSDEDLDKEVFLYDRLYGDDSQESQIHLWDLMSCSKTKQASKISFEKQGLLSSHASDQVRNYQQVEVPNISMMKPRFERNTISDIAKKFVEKFKTRRNEKYNYIPFETSSLGCEWESPGSSLGYSKGIMDGFEDLETIKDYSPEAALVQFKSSMDLWAIEETDDETYDDHFSPHRDICRRLNFEDEKDPFPSNKETFVEFNDTSFPIEDMISLISLLPEEMDLHEQTDKIFFTTNNADMHLDEEKSSSVNETAAEADSLLTNERSVSSPAIKMNDDETATPRQRNHVNSSNKEKFDFNKVDFTSSIDSLEGIELKPPFPDDQVEDIKLPSEEESDSTTVGSPQRRDEETIRINPTSSTIVSSPGDHNVEIINTAINYANPNKSSSSPSSKSVRELRTFFEKKLGLATNCSSLKTNGTQKTRAECNHPHQYHEESPKYSKYSFMLLRFPQMRTTTAISNQQSHLLSDNSLQVTPVSSPQPSSAKEPIQCPHVPSSQHQHDVESVIDSSSCPYPLVEKRNTINRN